MATSRRYLLTTTAVTLLVMTAFPEPSSAEPLVVTDRVTIGADNPEGYTRITVKEGGNLIVDGAELAGNISGATNGIIKVEGGQATINGGSIVNETSQWGNALAASGSAMVTINGTTLSTSGSAASASAGVYAGEQAEIRIIGGTVVATGTRGYGIRTIDNGMIIAENLVIETHGDFGYGAQIFAEEGEQTSITLKGGSITTNSEGYAPGIQSAGAGAYVSATDGFSIVTKGLGSAGISVDRGGSAYLADGSIVTSGNQASGLRAYRYSGTAESSITAERISITTMGDYASGVLVDTEGRDGMQAGATVELIDTDIRTEGLWAHGAHAIGAEDGNVNRISLVGGSIMTANNKGQFTQNGDGSRAYGLFAQGSGAVIDAAGTEIRTLGQRAYGAHALAGGSITLNDLSIETDGFMAYGVYASGEGSVITANNVTITTHGQVGDGAWAYDGGHTYLNGGSIHVLGDPDANEGSYVANGLFSINSAGGETESLIVAHDLTVVTQGANSRGVVAGDYIGTPEKGSRVGGAVELYGSSVTVRGAGADAAHVQFGGRLVAEGSSLVSENGVGIRLVDNATVVLDDTLVVAAGASLVSEFSAASQVQTITIGRGSNLTQNSGTLLLVQRSGEGSDGQITLTLESGSTSSGDILDTDAKTGHGMSTVVLEEGASWSGIMRGIDNFISSVGGRSEFEDGSEIAGNLEGSEGSTFEFKGSAMIGGNVAGQGSTFIFSQQTSTRIEGSVALLSGSSTSGGSVEKPITVEGDVDVDETSKLGGNWNIEGDLEVKGTLSPGNSIGMVTVAGNHTFGGSSIFDVEIDAEGNADRLNVTGTATLGGTVRVFPLDGSGDLRLGQAYTIVTAQGGFQGTAFDGAVWNHNSAFLSPELSYGSDSAYLTIERNDVAFASAAWTLNQTAVAEGLDHGDPLYGNAAYDAVALLSAQEASTAFDALSGEIHATAQNALFEESRHVRTTVTDRIRQAFAPAVASSDAAAPQGDLWMHGFGSWGETDGDGSAADAERNTGGFLIGADHSAFGNWKIGIAAGYSATSVDIDARASSAEVDSYHAALYGGAEFGAIGLRFGAANTWHRVETSRSIAFAGYSDFATASYDARTAQIFGEVGYQTDLGGLRVESFGGLAYVNHYTDSFSEHAGDAALHRRSSSEDLAFSTLGIRADTTVPVGEDAFVKLHGMLGWRHAFGNVSPQTSLALGGGHFFAVEGAAVARDAAVFEFGLDYAIGSNAAFGAVYAGQVSSEAANHELSARMKVSF